MRLVIVLFLFIAATSFGQQYTLQYVDTKVDASFRGMSVALHAVWVSGSKGWVGKSVDDGVTWTFNKVKGYEQCDFRSLYAFDSNTAVIANAGSPAYVLRTEDGGVSWKELYKNTDSAAFIDGIDFWKYNSVNPFSEKMKGKGLIHGDPIKGRMLLLSTNDSGRTWNEMEGPKLNDGEASFAASGTVISCFWPRNVVVATGGTVSRLFFSSDGGRRWKALSTPMLSGKEGRGIFSFWVAGNNDRHWLICGGDYREDTLRKDNFFYSNNAGKTWQAPTNTTRGYRECLASIGRGPISKIAGPTTKFAVGPSGIDMSDDEGVTWQAFSEDKGFHVMKAGVEKRCLFLAGANGKVAVIREVE